MMDPKEAVKVLRNLGEYIRETRCEDVSARHADAIDAVLAENAALRTEVERLQAEVNHWRQDGICVWKQRTEAAEARVAALVGALERAADHMAGAAQAADQVVREERARAEAGGGSNE